MRFLTREVPLYAKARDHSVGETSVMAIPPNRALAALAARARQARCPLLRTAKGSRVAAEGGVERGEFAEGKQPHRA